MGWAGTRNETPRPIYNRGQEGGRKKASGPSRIGVKKGEGRKKRLDSHLECEGGFRGGGEEKEKTQKAFSLKDMDVHLIFWGKNVGMGGGRR